jgi:4-aminobutyrate aminotransferase-like enzyme
MSLRFAAEPPTADGRPLAMAAAHAVLDELIDGALLSKVQDRSTELVRRSRTEWQHVRLSRGCTVAG